MGVYRQAYRLMCVCVWIYLRPLPRRGSQGYGLIETKTTSESHYPTANCPNDDAKRVDRESMCDADALVTKPQ